MTAGSDTRDFVTKFWDVPEQPTTLSAAERAAWEFRLMEEVNELRDAMLVADSEGMAHEAVDVAYTVAALVARMGVDWDACWAEVHRANMGKVKDPEGGKPAKPKGWLAADLTPFVDPR